MSPEYVITHIGRDYPGSSITRLGIRPRSGNTWGAMQIVPRSEVVRQITMGRVFFTAYQTAFGTWQLGERVRVVDGRYLRTDDNHTLADNLGNLPVL